MELFLVSGRQISYFQLNPFSPVGFKMFAYSDEITFGIDNLGSQWVVYDSTGDYEVYIANASDKKTHIGWYDKDGLNINTSDKLLYDCEGNKILDDKGKDISLKYETNKIPNLNELDGYSDGYFLRLTDAQAVNIDDCVTINPTIIYQNISQVVFIDGNLQVNNTLRKWNGDEFVIAPEDIWIREPEGNNFKFGANDTIATEDTSYQYEWISNKEIKFDRGYYYFGEEYIGETQFTKIYERRILDVSDVCIDGANCTFELLENGTRLLMNFTGFYNSTFGGIFIDPSYSVTNFSSSLTYNIQTRGEDAFGHLQIKNESIVGYWSFDVNDSGTTYDYSGYDNDGTVSNAVWNDSNGKYGSDYEFDDTSSYIDCGSDSSLAVVAGSFTISAWVKPSSIDSYDMIISKDDSSTTLNSGYRLMFDNGHHGRILVDNGSNQDAVTTSTVPLNSWTHIVATFNGTDLQIYHNGSLQATTQISGSLVSDNKQMVIGKKASQNSAYFGGAIDDITIWNTSLSAAEVQNLYSETYSKFYNQGNMTFKYQNVTLTSDNRANITVKGESLYDSNLSATIYGVNFTDYTNPTTSYKANDPNLVLYMHFDNWSSYGENDTHVYDFSGNGNNGTVSGALINTSNKKLGDATYRFDGDDDYINSNSGLINSTKPFTISAWIYAEGWGQGSFGNIYSEQNDFDFYLRGGNSGLGFYFYNPTSSVSSASNIFSLNEWTHVVYTSDENGNLNFYVNGENGNGAVTNLNNSIDVVGNAVIGAHVVGTSAYNFNGSIDEIAIWNRSLSAEEIKELYLIGSTNHSNNGAGIGINWTESSTGKQQLITFNATHLRASDFVISNTSDYLLTELFFNSTNGFYSPVVENVVLDSWEFSGVADTEYPQFSNYWDNNATLVDSGTGLFNVTITSTNGTVLLEIDGNNITATNLSANVYNASASLTSGTYTYYWHSWGNGTSHNYNNSGERSYTVNTSADTCTYSSGNWNVDCSDNCSITSNVVVDSGANITLSGTGFFEILANITTDLIAIESTCEIRNIPNDGKQLMIKGG